MFPRSGGGGPNVNSDYADEVFAEHGDSLKKGLPRSCFGLEDPRWEGGWQVGTPGPPVRGSVGEPSCAEAPFHRRSPKMTFWPGPRLSPKSRNVSLEAH